MNTKSWPGGFHPQHTHALTFGKIFVGGLKRQTTKKTLNEYFKLFGCVKRIDLVMDPKQPSRNKGFAFVHFSDVTGCERACEKGQFHEIDGREVEVKRAVLKPPGCEAAGINPTIYGYGVMEQYYNPNNVNGMMKNMTLK